MHPTERIFQAALQAGRLVHLRDMVKEAMATALPKCGLCRAWMANTCPREGRNEQGRRTGPNCNGAPCSQFSMEPWALELRDKRVADAVAFAKKHDLPLPAALS